MTSDRVGVVDLPQLVALRLLEADCPEGVYGVPEDWPRWRVLLPHVLAVTGRVADGAEAEAEAGIVSWLLDRAGTFLQTQGQPGAAYPLMQRALAIDESVHGPDHSDVAIQLSNLAAVLRDLGDAAGARPLAERALAIDEAVHGPDHPNVAIRLNTLAQVFLDLGDAAAARPLAERALAIGEAVYGPDHPVLGVYRANLAVIITVEADPQ